MAFPPFPQSKLLESLTTTHCSQFSLHSSPPHSLPPLQLFPTSAPQRKPLSLKSPMPSRMQHLTNTSFILIFLDLSAVFSFARHISCVLPNSLDASLPDAVRVLPCTVPSISLFLGSFLRLYALFQCLHLTGMSHGHLNLNMREGIERHSPLSNTLHP